MVFNKHKKTLRFFLLIALTLLLSCTKKQDFNIVNINNSISILGHSGMAKGNQYPPNSLESIIKCINIGADGAEFDVQMTKDSVLVIYHDELLEESTNGSGYIHDKNWSEIKHLNYTTFLETYKVASVEDVFQALKSPASYTFSFDCKNYSSDSSDELFARYSRTIAAIINKYDAFNNTYIEFQDERLIKSLKEINPTCKILVYQDYTSAVTLIEKYNLCGLVIRFNEISADQTNDLHQKGITVAVFSVKTKNDLFDAIDKNCDIIQTDNVPFAVKTLK
jgi:glycerophosphoryl diester phosphodiesterase